MVKWNPGKVIERIMRRLQERVAREVAAATPRVPHRSGMAFRGRTGGTLAQAVRAKSILKVRRWGAVLQLSKLGQKFLWFTQGTSRQKARPVTLAPDPVAVTRELQADAQRHFAARAAGRRR